MQTESVSVDLLTDEYFYDRAGTGKRFINYLVDIIVFFVVLMMIAVVLAFVAPAALDSFEGFNWFTARIISLVLYAVYMSLVEIIFKGKSFGKFITRTRAVNLDGSQISAQTAFGRGFSRAVPFCILSAFGAPCNPWQDKWTNTMVIEDKRM
jgi:uncharacterized RDD family membrane protein YckC